MRFAALLLLAVSPLWVASLTRSTQSPTASVLAATPTTTAPATIDANGRIYLDKGHPAHVRSPSFGRVVRVDAKPGDHVSAGASLAVVEENVDEAGPYDVAAWTAYCETETAALPLPSRASAYERCIPAPIARQRHAVTAPVEGTVLQSTAVMNTPVNGGAAGGGHDLFVVGDEPRWTAEAEVGEQAAKRVLPGARVRVHVAALPGVTIVGHVARVSPVDPATHVARVTCTVATLGLASDAYAAIEIPVATEASPI